MTTGRFERIAILAVMATGWCLVGPAARADAEPLAKFVGRWNVRVKTLQPPKPDVTYVETYEWVLGRKFIRARTEQKSDGTEDLVVGGYDPQTNGYPFWIFSSTGTYLYLAPASWNARTGSMEWKNPPGWDISYRGHCAFPDENTRRCTLLLKDWKGKVLLEQEITAVRRHD